MKYEYMEVDSLYSVERYSALGWRIVAVYFKPDSRFMDGKTWYVLEFELRGK